MKTVYISPHRIVTKMKHKIYNMPHNNSQNSQSFQTIDVFNSWTHFLFNNMVLIVFCILLRISSSKPKNQTAKATQTTPLIERIKKSKYGVWNNVFLNIYNSNGIGTETTVTMIQDLNKTKISVHVYPIIFTSRKGFIKIASIRDENNMTQDNETGE